MPVKKSDGGENSEKLITTQQDLFKNLEEGDDELAKFYYNSFQ
jgi:hypothetical protein